MIGMTRKILNRYLNGFIQIQFFKICWVERRFVRIFSLTNGVLWKLTLLIQDIT